jgi:hypothetical protein
MYELKKMESNLRVNLLGPGPSSYKKKYLPGRGLTKVGKHWSKQSLRALEQCFSNDGTRTIVRTRTVI